MSGVYVVPREVHVAHAHVPIGVNVTSLSRARLWRFMRRCADLYYCDTDSIVTTSTLPTSDELGELKHEHTLRSGVFAAPKFYKMLVEDEAPGGGIEIATKVRAKGFSWISPSDFDRLVSGGSVTYDRMVRLRENLRNGDTTPRETEITKHLLLANQPKRCALADGSTRPWTFRELEGTKV